MSETSTVETTPTEQGFNAVYRNEFGILSLRNDTGRTVVKSARDSALANGDDYVREGFDLAILGVMVGAMAPSDDCFVTIYDDLSDEQAVAFKVLVPMHTLVIVSDPERESDPI